MSSSPLGSLPADLLEPLIERLSVHEALTLRKIVSDKPSYHAVTSAIDRRCSVERYFTKHFGDGAAVLKSMSTNCVYLSGSRSADHFVRGTAVDESDWDMYINHDYINIYGFMHDMASLGVSWFTPEQELRFHYDNGHGTVVMDRDDFYKLDFNECMIRIAGESNTIVDSSFHSPVTMTPKVSVTVSGTSIKVCAMESHETGYCVGRIVAIIRGVVVRDKHSRQIQLIVENRNPFRVTAPFSYHSSCVQSFIGPYTSLHMYGQKSSEMQSYGWNGSIRPADGPKLTRSMRKDVKRIEVWSKYRDRGYKYEYPPTNLRPRIVQATDSSCTLLEYNFCKNTPDEVVSMYKEETYSMCWKQSASETTKIDVPTDIAQYLTNERVAEWFNSSDWNSKHDFVKLYFPSVGKHLDFPH